MHGARLAAEPAAELGEHLVDPAEDAPETLDVVRLVARVLRVFSERRRHRHAERPLANRHVDAGASKELVELPVEFGDRQTVDECERLDLPTVVAHDEPMIDEVEVDTERDAVLVHAPGRQPANVDVQRDVPPVVVGRRRCEAGEEIGLGACKIGFQLQRIDFGNESCL